MKKKRFPTKDLLEIVGIVAAIIISIIGLLQSNHSMQIAEDAISVNLAVGLKRFPENFFKDGPYNDYLLLVGPEPFLSDVYTNVIIQIDNLSQRDVSIRNVSAIALADDGPRSLTSASNSKEVALDDSLGMSLYLHETGAESAELNLPLLLKSGESVDIHGVIALTLSPETMTILRSRGDNENKTIDSRDAFEAFLRKNNIILGGACNSNECIGFGTVIETEPWHPLEIVITITTAFNTKHTVVLFIP